MGFRNIQEKLEKCIDFFFHFYCLNFRYDNDKPKDASNDRFILSKGHAAPILYAAHAMAGQFPIEDLQKLRKIDSDLEGMSLF